MKTGLAGYRLSWLPEETRQQVRVHGLQTHKNLSTLVALNHTDLGTTESLQNPQIERHSKNCLWAKKNMVSHTEAIFEMYVLLLDLQYSLLFSIFLINIYFHTISVV